MSALKFGKHAGEPLPTVPAAYLTFMLTKEDLWPDTRALIEGELKRRAAAKPARTASEDAEPLPDALRGDEERAVRSRCPCCGKPITLFVTVAK